MYALLTTACCLSLYTEPVKGDPTKPDPLSEIKKAWKEHEKNPRTIKIRAGRNWILRLFNSEELLCRELTKGWKGREKTLVPPGAHHEREGWSSTFILSR